MTDSAQPLATVSYAAAVVVAGLHFAFLGYLVFGGFAAWRWPRALWPHVAVVAWGMAGLVVVLPCPLTDIENQARRGAGLAPLDPAGFIAHYITGVWYPESAERFVQVLVLTGVLVSWFGNGVRVVRRRTAAAATVRPFPGSAQDSGAR